MRVLVSGAAGFLGCHLVDALLVQGHEVVGIDNLSTGRRTNLSHLGPENRFTFIERDVCDHLSIDGPVDRVYHLASPASPAAYATQRTATMKVNSAGTWRLLELALTKGARFLFTSTSEIYGDPQSDRQGEEYWGNVDPIGLRSMYEEGKRFGEACTMAYNRERQADTRIVRLFSTYGPRMHPDDGRVVTNFVRQALNGEALTVAGDGTQARSFCYVSDTIAGILLAMESDFYQPINIGNPEVVTILDLARLVIELVPGTKSKVAFVAGGEYDPRARRPDLVRARTILGWSPKVSLREGLEKTIEHYRRERQG